MFKEYFEATLKKLEAFLQEPLVRGIDYQISNTPFLEKYKGILPNDLASSIKKSIASGQVKDLKSASFNFAYLICQKIAVLDIDLTSEQLAKNITFIDVVNELNNFLKANGCNQLINLQHDFHTLSKRGLHIYFKINHPSLAIKAKGSIFVKGEKVSFDWLANREGIAQADFSMFMPPKEILNLGSEEYSKCYYQKPLGDCFENIKVLEPDSITAYAKLLNSKSYSGKYANVFSEQAQKSQSLAAEEAVLTEFEKAGSLKLQKYYNDFINLNVAELPIISAVHTISSNLDVIENLSKRLGGEVTLLEHTKALLEGKRLDGTSNNSICHFIDTYLLDASADLDSQEAESNFDKYLKSLFFLCQASNENITHFTQTLNSHIEKCYNSSVSKAKRLGFKNLEQKSSAPTIAQNLSELLTPALQDDCRNLTNQLSGYVTGIQRERKPLLFYHVLLDKYCIAYNGDSQFVPISLQSLKQLHYKHFGKKLGTKDGVAIESIPHLIPKFNPIDLDAQFFVDIEQKPVSKGIPFIYFNTYNPSHARKLFLSTDYAEDINYEFEKTENGLLQMLQANTPFTYDILQNICGGDKDSMVYLLSAIAQQLYLPGSVKQAIVLQDRGGTGKSTFVEMLRKMFDSTGPNITSDAINSRFLRKNFENQLIVHNEDLSGNCLTSNAFLNYLKSVVGNQFLRLEEKNAPQVVFQPYHLMFITTNYTGLFGVENGEVNRRLSIINALTNSKPLKQVGLWKLKYDEGNFHQAFASFENEMLNIVPYILSFMFEILKLKSKNEGQFLSASFQALNAHSRELLSASEVAEQVKVAFEANDTEASTHIEALNTIVSLANEDWDEHKASLFGSLIAHIRNQKVAAIPMRTLISTFGELGREIFLYLKTLFEGSYIKKYTTCRAVDYEMSLVTSRPCYNVLIIKKE